MGLSDKVSHSNVVLLAYNRPEMVRRRSLEALSWAGLGTLVISIDGPREGASTEERLWRSQTIAIASEMAKGNPRISVKIWRLNKGLTHHVLNALDEGFKTASNVILLEEDVKIGNEGLDFLAENSLSVAPAISAGYVRALHVKDNGERIAFFPEQWGLAMNAPFFEQLKRVVSRGQIDERVVAKYVHLFLGSRRIILQRRLTKYWSRLFRSAMKAPSHTDALFHYTAMTCLTPYRAPWTSLVEDEGHLDDRGLHPRSKSAARTKSHKVREAEEICQSCEFTNMRGPVLVGPYYWYSLIYHWASGKSNLGTRRFS